MRRWIEAGIVAGTLAAAFLLTGRGSEQAQQAPDSRPAEEFRLVPVRVHLFRASDAPAFGTTLKTEDITRIVRKANGIWHAAGVHLWVESIVEEKPVLTDSQVHDNPVPLDSLLPLRPKASLADGMFHVYYVGALPVNGIFMRRDGIFVQEAAKLRIVPGGIDEPLPRVTAHELGHGMGLPHRQAQTNLLASGTTGTSLNDAEIEIVRRKLDTFPWTLPAEDFLQRANELAASDSAAKKAEATSRYQALLDLPGKSSLKEQARERLDKMKG